MRTPPGPLPRRTTRTGPATARTTLRARARTGVPPAPRRAAVAYDGERALTDAPFALPPVLVPRGAGATTPDGVPAPTITAPAPPPVRRIPPYADPSGPTRTAHAGPSGRPRTAHAAPSGRPCHVFGLRTAPRAGGDQPGPRIVSHRDAAWAGALFAAVDAR